MPRAGHTAGPPLIPDLRTNRSPLYCAGPYDALPPPSSESSGSFLFLLFLHHNDRHNDRNDHHDNDRDDNSDGFIHPQPVRIGHRDDLAAESERSVLRRIEQECHGNIFHVRRAENVESVDPSCPDGIYPVLIGQIHDLDVFFHNVVIRVKQRYVGRIVYRRIRIGIGRVLQIRFRAVEHHMQRRLSHLSFEPISALAPVGVVSHFGGRTADVESPHFGGGEAQQRSAVKHTVGLQPFGRSRPALLGGGHIIIVITSRKSKNRNRDHRRQNDSDKKFPHSCPPIKPIRKKRSAHSREKPSAFIYYHTRAHMTSRILSV